ncbi:HTH Tnp Tc3 2 domain containing protein, partial [Asbolus verrucosus]
MSKVYGEDGPSLYQIKFWSKQFKWCRESVEDDPRPGRPTEATNKAICKKIEDLVLEERRIKISFIASELKISVGSVWNILHNVLGMNKVSARWVPRLLTPEQKLKRHEICQQNLLALEEDPDLFSRIVTGDETWVHHWEPETKMES